jgi:hypothetical protein
LNSIVHLFLITYAKNGVINLFPPGHYKSTSDILLKKALQNMRVLCSHLESTLIYKKKIIIFINFGTSNIFNNKSCTVQLYIGLLCNKHVMKTHLEHKGMRNGEQTILKKLRDKVKYVIHSSWITPSEVYQAFHGISTTLYCDIWSPSTITPFAIHLPSNIQAAES